MNTVKVRHVTNLGYWLAITELLSLSDSCTRVRDTGARGLTTSPAQSSMIRNL